MNARTGRALAAVATCALLAPVAEASQQRTQSFTLRPGWNAVYLEVTPVQPAPAQAFSGIPVLSAWTWSPRPSPVDFIQDPAEGLFNRPGWLGYFPSGPEAALTNLFTLEANRAYLIKLDGAGPVTWTVTGRPALQSFSWSPNSFNLVGLPVEQGAPPTLGAYFAPSDAHRDQPIYRLDAAGFWQPVANPWLVSAVAGEAYWVYCAGASSYTGPLAVQLEQGDGVDFGEALTQHEIRVRNVGPAPTTVRVSVLAANNLPLLHLGLGPNGENTWPLMPNPLSAVAASGAEVSFILGIRRSDMGGNLGEGVLEVADGRGTRRFVPVRVEKLPGTVDLGPAGPALDFDGRLRASVPDLAFARGLVAAPLALLQAGPPNPLAGLWVGSVTVRAVSNSQLIDGTGAQTGTDVTTPVRDPLSFRVMLHVDGSGQLRLLKDVIQMWREGTGGAPGHFVLVTDPALITQFAGATLRDGEPVGRRMSAVAYDFAGETLSLAGAVGGTVTGTITLDKDAPTNPFRHRYHPDHDNLSPLGAPADEAYPVTRALEFTFTAADPAGLTPPQWGSAMLGGTYKETLTGVHKNPIVVEGTFRLTRAVATAELNQ